MIQYTNKINPYTIIVGVVHAFYCSFNTNADLAMLYDRIDETIEDFDELNELFELLVSSMRTAINNN